MITLTRKELSQLRSVFRKALNITSRNTAPAVTLRSGPQGLVISAQSFEAAVEYRRPGELPVAEVRVPWELIGQCQGRKDEPVELTLSEDAKHITARWQEKGIPQVASYSVLEPDKKPIPDLPAEWTENEPQLLAALDAAAETTDSDSVRYATHCVQLDGDRGSLAATDGRQLLVQSTPAGAQAG